MNIIVKIAVLIFTYIIFSSILKSYRPEYIFLLRIATVLLILIFSVDYLTEFITSYLTIFSIFNIDSAHISLLIKVVGIAILSDVISDNLKDTCEHSLSNIVIISHFHSINQYIPTNFSYPSYTIPLFYVVFRLEKPHRPL